MQKKLYRYPKDGILFGIGSGIGKYFNVDPVFVRLAMVVLILLTGVWPGIVLYIILFFIMPVEPSQQKVDREQSPRDVTPSSDVPQSDTKQAPEENEANDGQPTEKMDSTQNM